MKKLITASAALFATLAIASNTITKEPNTGKVYTNGYRSMPALGLHSSGAFVPIQMDTNGNVQTTSTDSALSLISTQTKEANSGTVFIDTGDGRPMLGAPLMGLDTNGNFQPITVDGSGKLMTSGGSVSSVTASSPLASSGGTTPNITCSSADSTHSGCVVSSDWVSFNAATLASDNVVYVSTTGSDTACPATPCGNGSPSKPYLTPTTANNAITTATPSNPFVIILGPGSYTAPTALKPNIGYMGFGRDATILNMPTGGALLSHSTGFDFIWFKDLNLIQGVSKPLTITQTTDSGGSITIHFIQVRGSGLGGVVVNGATSATTSVQIQSSQFLTNTTFHSALIFAPPNNYFGNRITVDALGSLSGSNTPITVSCNTVNGSQTITCPGISGSGIAQGQMFSGTGIQVGSLVGPINTGANTFTSSKTATATNTGVTLSFIKNLTSTAQIYGGAHAGFTISGISSGLLRGTYGQGSIIINDVGTTLSATADAINTNSVTYGNGATNAQLTLESDARATSYVATTPLDWSTWTTTPTTVTGALDAGATQIKANIASISSNTASIATNASAISTETSRATAAEALKVAKAGDTMTGVLTGPGYQLTGGDELVGDGVAYTSKLGLIFTASNHDACMGDVDDNFVNGMSVCARESTGTIDFTSASASHQMQYTAAGRLSGIVNPSSAQDAATKSYVDGLVSASESAIGTPANDKWIDCANGSNAGTPGSAVHPYLTTQAAMTAIGSAADATAFNANGTSFYRVHVLGTCTENVSIPTRQVIVLDMEAGTIIGNLTQSVDHSILSGTAQNTKLIIKGADRRSVYGGVIPITGIQGDVIEQATGTGTKSQFVEVLHSGVTGNINYNQGSATAITGFVMLDDAMIKGTIETTGTVGSNITLYATNCDTSGTNAINGVAGSVVLNILNHVRFDGIVQTLASQSGARWNSVDFKSSTAHDFTGASGAVSMDAASAKSWTDNVPTKGTVSISAIDTPLLTSAHLFVGSSGGYAADVAASGDLTLANTGAFTIANSAVTNAKLANMADQTIKGNVSGGSAAPVDLTAAQVNTMTGALVGPGSSTDTALVKFSGTGGKTALNSGVTLDSSNNMVFPASSSISVPRTSSGTHVEAFGAAAGNTSSTGNNTTAVGYHAGTALTSGASNTLMGQNAGAALTSAAQNTAVGDAALATQATATINDNTAIGYHALNLLNGAGTSSNTAVGSQAMAFSTANAVDDTCVGHKCMYNASIGSRNSCVGSQCGFNLNTADTNNTFMGYLAGKTLGGSSGAIGNTAIGSMALDGATTITTGSYNIALGYSAGFDTTATTGHTLWVGNTSSGAFGINTVTMESDNANGAVWTQPLELQGNVTVDAHIRQNGTAATATVNANAGTGATCTVANATDLSGEISLTTTAVSPASGEQCKVNFATAFSSFAHCQLTPTNGNDSLQLVANGISFPTTTAKLGINFANADVTGHTYAWTYTCTGN